ncbi:MAG: proprotein convertase P-domain-containing protein [Myxococcaceae bacterium]|nr:proprotein convertase P-domain-containing protein [Myxococcaceae bacterium]
MVPSHRFIAFSFATLTLACTQTAVVSSSNEQPKSVTGKALLNAQGPDITINAARLQASVQVLTNQTISQQEVEDGCAVGGTTNRTLIRFDVETPNNGPGDLAAGDPSCRSTDTSASCAGVDCDLAPSCCSGGRHVCTVTGNPELGRGFEYNSAHRHIHFRSFAQYRLLTPTGAIAAQGHKQSFCLMDMLDVTPGSCSRKFGCGNQGISAGCADLYSAFLPCGFVDVTGVPGGDYQLEVVMDPEDIINESNEVNNRVLVNVRVPENDGPPPPPPPGHQLFLVRDGVGDVVQATQYYRTLLPGTDINSYSLDQWKLDHVGARPTVTGLYRNVAELGYWREMTCTATLARGQGGCFVTNWNEVDDRQRGAPNLGTVAMNISPDGFTRFYVFSPQGVLQPFAVLDDEGNKFVPQACTSCHGGGYQPQRGPDLGSVFREFEPSQLQPRPGIDATEAQAEWFALNQAIRSANAALRGEAQGAPFGVDHAKAVITTYLDEMYPSGAPPALGVKDAAHVPASWRDGVSGPALDARVQVFTKLVNPYCQTCHRLNSIDFTNYAQWSLVQAESGGRPLIRRYISVDPSDPNRQQLTFMPQSKLAFESLQNDAEALIALDGWLQAPSNSPPLLAVTGASGDVNTGATAELHVTATDIDNDPVTFQWEVASGPAVTFSPAANAADVAFVAPHVTAPTPLTVRVRGSDGRGGVSVATRAFVVQPFQVEARLVFSATPALAIPDNNPAGIVSTLDVADPRTARNLKVSFDITHTYIGDLRVTLRAPGFTKVLHANSGREADDLHVTLDVPEAVGQPLAGTWSLAVVDSVGIDVGTLDAWKLDFGVSEPAPNGAPLANAGPDLTATTLATVTLDGSGSSDPDGDALVYQWSGPVTLAGANTAHPTFTAPATAQTLELTLTVTDPSGLFATDTVRVAVSAPPPPMGRLLIAELMVNPTGTDADREWVKLYNGTGATVDLSQWSLGYGGDPAWGSGGSTTGATVALSGMLPAGKCVLIGGPLSSVENGFPSFTLGADYGLTVARRFTGYGLQNPVTASPDAVALFAVPAAQVRATTSPSDIVVYHSTTVNPPASPYRGVTTATAPVNIITSFDGAVGRSFRRVRVGQWEVSGKSGGTDGAPPSPNACTVILP